MTTIRLKNKTYDLKLGYAQLRKLEQDNPGASFENLLGDSLENPSFSTVEKMLYLMIQKPDFKEEDLTELLDKSFESGDMTFMDVMAKITEAVETSVFFQGMAAKQAQMAQQATSKQELAASKLI